MPRGHCPCVAGSVRVSCSRSSQCSGSQRLVCCSPSLALRWAGSQCPSLRTLPAPPSPAPRPRPARSSPVTCPAVGGSGRTISSTENPYVLEDKGVIGGQRWWKCSKETGGLRRPASLYPQCLAAPGPLCAFPVWGARRGIAPGCCSVWVHRDCARLCCGLNPHSGSLFPCFAGGAWPW